MSGTRASANHELYLAKILLAAWRRELSREDIPALILAQAFHDAVKDHLLLAYGWFLLAISQVDTPLQDPPRSCDDLPPMPEGRVYPPEINEFRQLEAQGWLCNMLQSQALGPPQARRSGNLATPLQQQPEIEALEHWREQLQAMFERMGDSLDEY